MADNFLEKKYEETFGADAKKKVVVKRNNPSLETLLHRNRSHRGFDSGVTVSRSKLEEIISVNPLLPSAGNRQTLRFRPVTGVEAAKVMGLLRFGAALPELHLPAAGEEPKAFIVVCSTAPETRFIDMDLGISLQSMGLKAVEMGLNALIVGAFDREKLQEVLDLPYLPLAVLAVGKGTDTVFLKPVREGESLAYYRRDGVHYVPKIRAEDLLV